MKRIGMFLFAAALAGFAFATGPTSEAAVLCQKPNCLLSPGCCIARECGTWCASRGGTPACGGNGSGGCCYCIPPAS